MPLFLERILDKMHYKKISPTRKSPRLEEYDYSSAGIYVVTICTKNRECFFGDVIDGRMELNNAGKKVKELWSIIPNKFENVEIDAFVVMPNHLHGIVIIGKEGDVVKSVAIGPDAINRVPTPAANEGGGVTGAYNPMLSMNSLSRIIRWYKGRCTFEIKKIDNPGYFEWQGRFYDHIVRNKKDLKKIREYIQTNPQKWASDQLNPKNPL